MPLLHGFAVRGYLGVDLFAFLSGFVITYGYGDRLARPRSAEIGRFVALRLARIYPLALFVLLAFLAIEVGREGTGALGETLRAPTFLRQLLLVNGWGFETQFAWNVPSWTVSSEWAWYLLFPLLAPAFARIERAGTAVTLAAATVAATIAAMYAVGHTDSRAYLDWGVVRIGGAFVAGGLLERAHRAGFGAERPWGPIGLAAFVGGGVAAIYWPPVAFVLFAVLVYALAQRPALLDACFSNRGMVWLGEISYSI